MSTKTMKGTSAASARKVTTTAVPRGQWQSNQSWRVVSQGGMMLPALDIIIMNIYDNLVADGGSSVWEMKATSNGSFYVFPDKSDTKPVRITSPNGYTAIVSVECSGLIATMFALALLSHRDFDRSDEHSAAAVSYHRLVAFAAEHPEADSISSLID